ncbi:diphthine--ammonia ligase [Sarracenia purpurea var. burkii]
MHKTSRSIKRALVEVKPILYAVDDTEMKTGFVVQDLSSEAQSFWGFSHEPWHDSCFQKFVVPGELCAVFLSINDELAVKIFPECTGGAKLDNGVHPNSLKERQMDRIAKFSIFLLDRIISENHFSWDDVTNLRLYYPTCLRISHESLSLIFTVVFDEFAEMTKRIQISEEPIFTLVPVLGAGRFATSMDDVITCELFAQKSFSNLGN